VYLYEILFTCCKRNKEQKNNFKFLKFVIYQNFFIIPTIRILDLWSDTDTVMPLFPLTVAT